MKIPLFKVFIQSNRKQYFGALIAKYSILSQSKSLQESQIEIMLVEDQPDMLKYDGKKYLRKGIWETWSSQDLQSFTMTRFLPPQLMNFQGRALVIDPDVFATPGADVMELFQRDMNGKAILACSAGENTYKSSVMLLDCAQLSSWKWPELIDQVFTGKRDYRDWMNLKLEDPNSVGILEEEWNHCDKMNGKTKLIHYTRRLTQPWKTGLKVDFIYDVGNSRLNFLPQPILRMTQKILRRGGQQHSCYQANPSTEQTKFFFKLVKEALSEGVVTQEFVDRCVLQGYVRSDINSVLSKEL